MQVESYRSQSLPANSDVTNCIQAAAMFKEALRTKQLSQFFDKIDLGELPQEISVTEKNVAVLEIKFRENLLITDFNGQLNTIKLSVALGIFRDIAEIFAKIQRALENSKNDPLLLTEDQCTNALGSLDSIQSDMVLKVDGEAVINIYPLKQRVVLSTERGQSSMPMHMVQDCSHLFNQAFADHICPLLGVESKISRLHEAITNIYLGRCLLGLGNSIANKCCGEVSHVRELTRLVSLIAQPGSAFYSNPIR